MNPPRHTYPDRRQYPRIDYGPAPATLRRDGREVEARVRDVSPGGMQVRCAPAALDLLDPERQRIGPGHLPAVEARFAVALRAGPADIRVECLVVYAREESPAELCVGLRFTNFHGAGLETLARFVEESLEPS